MGFQNTQTQPGVGTPENDISGFSAAVADTTLSEALITLRKRRWVLITAVLLGLAYGIYKAETQPKMFDG
jgi:polysaccharide biosynthesis transport protein